MASPDMSIWSTWVVLTNCGSKTNLRQWAPIMNVLNDVCCYFWMNLLHTDCSFNYYYYYFFFVFTVSTFHIIWKLLLSKSFAKMLEIALWYMKTTMCKCETRKRNLIIKSDSKGLALISKSNFLPWAAALCHCSKALW